MNPILFRLLILVLSALAGYLFGWGALAGYAVGVLAASCDRGSK